MRKQGLYTAAGPKPRGEAAIAVAPVPAASGNKTSPSRSAARPAWYQALGRRALIAFSLVLLTALALAWWGGSRPDAVPGFDQASFDAAFGRALAQRDKQYGTGPAYAAVAPSLVRIRSFKRDEASRDASDKMREGVGTGVVIVDTGVILTALHVVNDMDQVVVQFHDGSESPAFIVSKRPEQDLAVLRVGRVPDELVAARLASSADLRTGDAVIAVGFPFGFGPSVSAGVVSGLNREFRALEGQVPLRRLIQFDAAVNPGNSGGPLLNMAGEVVGIVVALFNPSKQSFFVGLAFAVPIENAASAAGVVPF